MLISQTPFVIFNAQYCLDPAQLGTAGVHGVWSTEQRKNNGMRMLISQTPFVIFNAQYCVDPAQLGTAGVHGVWILASCLSKQQNDKQRGRKSQEQMNVI
jgi:hypothetical protein